MQVDISKYNLYRKIQKKISKRELMDLGESYSMFQVNSGINYKIRNIELYFLDIEFLKNSKDFINYYEFFKQEKPFHIEIPENLYIPYEGSGKIQLAYEYYSKAYINPLSFIYEDLKDFKPSYIKGYIDIFGRLHIFPEYHSILSFISCIENKLPYIYTYIPTLDFRKNSELFYTDLSDITPSNQILLAKNFVEPYILINDCYENKDYVMMFADKGSICYNILKQVPWKVMQYFINNFYLKNEIALVYKELPAINGYIFPDGSYIYFKRSFQHLHFIRLFYNKYSYNEDLLYWIKLGNIRNTDITDAYYDSNKITSEQRKQLYLLKRKFYIEEFNIPQID